MRIRIAHETVYSYEEPIRYAIETLRLTPRSHDGQFVCRWRLDIDADCRLHKEEDHFGNITHTFTIEGPQERLRIHAEGEIETEDRQGFVRNTVERLPPGFYLRQSDLAVADAAIRVFAQDVAAGEGGDRLAALHALMRALHAHMRFDKVATSSTTTAAEAFAARHGVCQDFAHIFIAAARHMGLPARYVSGYLHRHDGEHTQEAGHAWAEAYVQGYGWIGFDPANNLCPTEHYVRISTGLDYLGAAPIRGVQTGGAGEQLKVSVHVEPAVRIRRPIPHIAPEVLEQMPMHQSQMSG